MGDLIWTKDAANIEFVTTHPFPVSQSTIFSQFDDFHHISEL